MPIRHHSHTVIFHMSFCLPYYKSGFYACATFLWFGLLISQSVCASHFDLVNKIETKLFCESSSNLAGMLTVTLLILNVKGHGYGQIWKSVGMLCFASLLSVIPDVSGLVTFYTYIFFMLTITRCRDFKLGMHIPIISSVAFSSCHLSKACISLLSEF